MEADELAIYPMPAGQNALNDCRANPAFGFYGRRLFADQKPPEFLNELLLILFSPKRLRGQPDNIITACLPDPASLQAAAADTWEYAPKARLNLKLFSFWSASRLNARHPAHRAHFEGLRQLLRQSLSVEPKQETENALDDLESLFVGLRSTGEGRTWCAQQFLPLGDEFLSSEAIWEAKKGAKISEWEDALRFFSLTKYIFMARGGEVLFAQICLALSQSQAAISEWNNDADLGLMEEEADPARLHTALEGSLRELMQGCGPINALARHICSLERDTAERTDMAGEEPRFQELGWCSARSWREGYLFAVELLRLARAPIDIMDKIHLLETACALHILRTLAARTAALSDDGLPDWPGYILPFTAKDEPNAMLRSVSNMVFKRMRMMQQRLIINELPRFTPPKSMSEAEKKKYLERKVSAKYGAGLYSALAKGWLGIVAPRTGAGERFVLPLRVLRLLVLTLTPAQKCLTLDTFKKRMRSWHGFAFDAEGFEQAHSWLTGRRAPFPARCDDWLKDLLADGDFLLRLSDASSLVRSPLS